MKEGHREPSQTCLRGRVQGLGPECGQHGGEKQFWGQGDKVTGQGQAIFQVNRGGTEWTEMPFTSEQINPREGTDLTEMWTGKKSETSA